MPDQEQAKPATQDAWIMLSFKIPPNFKKALDQAVYDRRVTIRELCTKAIAKELDIPVPEEAQAS